ncbi:MAG: glycosyltransferase family 4 protein [Plesiomonas shigelloides]
MKVLFANKFFFIKGGAETVLFQEREMVRQAGHQVIDFAMQHPDNLPSPQSGYFPANVDYHQRHGLIDRLKIAARFIHNQEACDRLADLIRAERPDIVHFHNIYHQLTPGIIQVAKSLGCKTVLTAHDYKVACPNYSMLVEGKLFNLTRIEGSWLKLFRHQWQEGSWGKSLLLSAEAAWQQWRRNYQQVDAFVAPSAFMAQIIRSRLPDSRIEVIFNGIDVELSSESGEDQGYFLFLGRLMPEKGVETLALAHQRMTSRARLKIVGNGPMLARLKQDYPNVELLGFKQGEELLDLLRHAKAVVVPSESYENCSMSLLEAMAYSKSVIGARIGGIPEQIRDGIDGLLFEAGNADELARCMDRLVADPEQTAAMGHSARQRLIERYSLASHKLSLLGLYQSLLEEEPR